MSTVLSPGPTSWSRLTSASSDSPRNHSTHHSAHLIVQSNSLSVPGSVSSSANVKCPDQLERQRDRVQALTDRNDEERFIVAVGTPSSRGVLRRGSGRPPRVVASTQSDRSIPGSATRLARWGEIGDRRRAAHHRDGELRARAPDVLAVVEYPGAS